MYTVVVLFGSPLNPSNRRKHGCMHVRLFSCTLRLQAPDASGMTGWRFDPCTNQWDWNLVALQSSQQSPVTFCPYCFKFTKLIKTVFFPTHLFSLFSGNGLCMFKGCVSGVSYSLSCFLNLYLQNSLPITCKSALGSNRAVTFSDTTEKSRAATESRHQEVCLVTVQGRYMWCSDISNQWAITLCKSVGAHVFGSLVILLGLMF